MAVIRCYVRGHGGVEGKPLLPAEDLPIDLITVGQVGCTMSDEAAEMIIQGHWNADQIQDAIDAEYFIYWTKAERDDWYDNRVLNYTKPSLNRTQYVTMVNNFALDGAADLGPCGLFYWESQSATLLPLIRVDAGQTILLSEMLDILKSITDQSHQVELYWTACMSGDCWSGDAKKISINPEKK